MVTPGSCHHHCEEMSFSRTKFFPPNTLNDHVYISTTELCRNLEKSVQFSFNDFSKILCSDDRVLNTELTVLNTFIEVFHYNAYKCNVLRIHLEYILKNTLEKLCCNFYSFHAVPHCY